MLILAITSFVLEWLPMEVTAMGATTLLLVFNIIDVDDAVQGFSNSAVIVIGAIFIISRSLVKTGFLEVLADTLIKITGNNKWLSIFIFLIIVSSISGFINNTAAVAIFIPLALDIANRFHISPTKILLPLSYASIFGGTLTLIGTSTNLIISSIITDYSLDPFSMFEFTKMGLVFLFIGMIYNMIIIRWFLPSRAVTNSLTMKYHLRTYLTEFQIASDSPLIGKKHTELNLLEEYNLLVLKIIRGKKSFRFNLQSINLMDGDIVLAQINAKNMLRFKDDMKVLLLPDMKLNQTELMGQNHVIVEGLVPQQSKIIGKTLKEFDFRNRYRAFVLAIKRQQHLLREKIAKIRLKFSDTILIMVPKDKLKSLRSNLDLIILEELDIHLRYEKFWWFSILVIPSIMILVTFGFLDIKKATLIGASILLILKTISIDDAYESINWQVIFLIAFLIPLGTAIRNTELDILIGDLIINLNNYFSSTLNPVIILSILYFITFILSAFISNAAVAIILTPVGIILANNLSIDPRPFIVAICFGASASFMTPMGYQTNLMVFAPGQYRFSDFFKMGFPLTLIYWIVSIYFIPKIWPFY